MGICKGNLGNLLQHWLLCELIDYLSHGTHQHVLFICTHSMAPWSVPEVIDYGSIHSPRLHGRKPFDQVRQRLFGNPQSSYERYWQRLASHTGNPYPSSAVFARAAWKRTLSMLLCEHNSSNCDEIRAWMSLPEIKSQLLHASLHPGNWRDGLDSSIIPIIQPDLVVVELDPMQFEHRSPVEGNDRNAALIYPDDMDQLMRFCSTIKVPIVIQVSSYNTNNGNSHTKTIPAISKPLLAHGFTEAARVYPNNLMVSLVFCRGINLWSSSAILNQRFNAWLPN